MRRLTPDDARASLDRLRAALASSPRAAARGRLGQRSTIELIDDWRGRVQSLDIVPDALPNLFFSQARRHVRHPDVVEPLVREERWLRQKLGEVPSGYGWRPYFGRHALDDDD